MKNLPKLNVTIFFLLLSFPLTGHGNYFKDNFNNGYATQWKSFGGTWKVVNKQYTSNECFGFALAENTSFISFSYEADIILKGGGKAGLIFNATDPDLGGDSLNCYYAALNIEKSKFCFYKIKRKLDHTRKIPKGNRIENNREEMITVPYTILENKPYHIKIIKKGFFIDVFVNNRHMVSIADKTHDTGLVGLRSDFCDAVFDNILVKEKPFTKMIAYDWSWVKGAIYIPTNCVNQVQQWEEFDPVINDRELSYAHTYGINLVRIYLHYLVWEKDKKKFLNDLETFLRLADKNSIKTEIIFFDDIWDKYPHLGPQLPPIPSIHNSRWMQCPGDSIKDQYDTYAEKLKAYVQDVVHAHKHDRRISFWEPYNEPGFSQEGKYVEISRRLLNDSRIWIKQTGTSIPLTNTAEPGFMGEAFSDFFSWHNYEKQYGGPRGNQVLNTECMNRNDQSVPGIIENYGNQGTGYIIWELGIGRDNCRFPWDTPKDAPEVTKPFHGLLYPDGHPWDTCDIFAIKGNLNNMKVFDVSYSIGNFSKEKKKSITPLIDFDLGDERGTGSPDASAGIDKDSFSIRWIGNIITPRKGFYTFYIDCDNIARLWINGHPLLNKASQQREEVQTTINLSNEKLQEIKVEYIHYTGNASMHLKWSGPGFSKQPITATRKNNH